jgi:hypothetical protein
MVSDPKVRSTVLVLVASPPATEGLEVHLAVTPVILMFPRIGDVGTIIQIGQQV